MDIVQMTLSASVLIVVIVIIRALTLHKLPKKTFLVLWGVVICRLLIPFSISSRFSLYTGIDTVKRMFTERTVLSSPAGMTVIPNMTPGTGKLTGIGTSTVSILPIEIAWLVGMFACALFFIVAYIKCRREFKTSLPIENDFVAHWLREHPLRRPVQIRQSDRIKAPLTYGVFRPVILLPKKTDWTDEVRLKVILTHELVHIRRFDTLTKLVLTAAVCVHWFNPFVWIMYVLANRDIELSCDETVVRTFGETIKSAYALTLLGLEEKKSQLTPLVNNFSKNAIEERIVSIMKMKKTSLVGIMLALALVIGTATVFATNAASAAASGVEIPSDAIHNHSVSFPTDPNTKIEARFSAETDFSVKSHTVTNQVTNDTVYHIIRLYTGNLKERLPEREKEYTNINIELLPEERTGEKATMVCYQNTENLLAGSRTPTEEELRALHNQSQAPDNATSDVNLANDSK